MGLEVGGYTDRPDWPKIGPSPLISSCLILAIRTAKWPASHDEKFSNHDLDEEIDHSIALARSVLSKLLARRDSIFPQKREAWYQPDDEDIPSDRQSKRAVSLSSRRPPLSDFSKICFGEQTTAMPFRNHLGFAGKPALPLLFRCHISCKSFLIALP